MVSSHLMMASYLAEYFYCEWPKPIAAGGWSGPWTYLAGCLPLPRPWDPASLDLRKLGSHAKRRSVLRIAAQGSDRAPCWVLYGAHSELDWTLHCAKNR